MNDVEILEKLRQKGNLECINPDHKKKKFRYMVVSIPEMARTAGVTKHVYENFLLGKTTFEPEVIDKLFLRLGYVRLTIGIFGANKSFFVRKSIHDEINT